MAQGAAATPLVGRGRELATLEQALDEAAAGRGGLALLTGEAGIGKTTLARALGERAEERGIVTVWGPCWDGGGAPAYWPWIQVLRALGRRRDVQRMTGELGDGAPWIASLVADLAGPLGVTGPPPELDADQARFRLFDALGRMLGAAAAVGPLVVVLDDLHWADASSLFALEFVARTLPDLPVLAVATYRQGEAHEREDLTLALGRLARAAFRLPLEGLSRDELAQLLTRHGDEASEPAPKLVDALHSATAGNPFFADELAQLLAAQGRLRSVSADDPLPLPEGVREAIRRRLAPLGAPTLEALAAAAVVGTEFRVRTLADVLQITPGEVLELLGPASRIGLLVAREDGGRQAFAHALVRDTLLHDLGAARRGELHLAVGDALERVYAGDLEDRVSELAHHFLAALPSGDLARAVDYAERAARGALAQAGYDEAAVLFARAADAAEDLPRDEPRRWRLAQGLGDARMRAGDVPGARAALTESAASARRLDDPRRFGQAALGWGLWALAPGVVEDEHVALLEEGIARMDGAGAEAEDDALRAQLRLRLASALYWSPDHARRAAIVDEALALARELQERPGADRAARRTLAWALGRGSVATWGPDTLEQGLERSAEALALCEGTEDAELAMEMHAYRMSLLLEAGDIAGADREIEGHATLARRLGQPRTQLFVPLHRALRAHLRGDAEEADRRSEEAMTLAQEVPGSVVPVMSAAQLFFIRRSQGRIAEMTPHVQAFAHALPAMSAWRGGLALTLALTGRPAEAAAELDHLAAAGIEAIARDNLWTMTMALLTETCAIVGDGARAAEIYALLAPLDGRNVVSPGAAVLGPVSRFLGVLAATSGDDARAREHLHAARAAAERMGARGMLEEIAADLRRLDGVEPPAAPAGAPPDAILEREHDVWTLSFEGRTLRLPDAKGLRFLATLLGAPGTEFHALALAGDADSGHANGDPRSPEAERARVNVTRAIRTTLRRVAAHDQDLARVLDVGVRTGTFCAYELDPLRPVRWEVRA